MTLTKAHFDLKKKIEDACQKMAPLWPLKNFVAVNPYFGLRNQLFRDADQTLEKLTGTGLYMTNEYYRNQMRKGQITDKDLKMALLAFDLPDDTETFKSQLERVLEKKNPPIPLLSDVLGFLDHQDWSNFVIERISHFCAAYFDEGQALWKMPFRDQFFYRGWVEFSKLDKSPWMMGLREMNKLAGDLPLDPEDCIDWALGELGVPFESIELYLHRSLLSIPGWAGWTRYLNWQAQLKKEQDHSIRDLLAVRLAWDALLYKMRHGPELSRKWKEALEDFTPSNSPGPEQTVGTILHTALEMGYRRRLIGDLLSPKDPVSKEQRADLQAIFCIDVRSEIFRRALEQVAPSTETLGFAGFFGLLVEYLPFGSNKAKNHLPILFNPAYRIREVPAGSSSVEFQKLADKRHLRAGASDIWKVFKTSAASCFSFVESFGLWSVVKLVGNTMGWSRPVGHPDSKGLKEKELKRMSPVLGNTQEFENTIGDSETGIPESDRPGVAEFALRNMGLIRNFSRLILLVGHGSTTANNPQATGLDCGACAGQTGEISARIASALLNDRATRKGLASDKGIVIPEDTFFIPALHDTTTDDVILFDTHILPHSHKEELLRLKEWLFQAGQASRLERATLLGVGDLSPDKTTNNLRRRTKDWSEVRPEWGLAGNAAFIAAPRSRTSGINLQGRAFLHNYNWQDDQDFKTLELIMSAPMIVANWINMQYYGSVVDNRFFGSGNKVLHNVVGGAIGVLEGNGGDLRTGLSIQSLNNGTEWVHEPIRLHVIIEAPQTPIDKIIEKNSVVRELVENEWLHFFNMDNGGKIHQRLPDGRWKELLSDR